MISAKSVHAKQRCYKIHFVHLKNGKMMFSLILGTTQRIGKLKKVRQQGQIQKPVCLSEQYDIDDA